MGPALAETPSATSDDVQSPRRGHHKIFLGMLTQQSLITRLLGVLPGVDIRIVGDRTQRRKGHLK